MKKTRKTTLVLLLLAVVLLLSSVVGSTNAALTYFSEYYSAEVTVSNIGVTLNENGTAVNWRNYVGDANWDINAEGGKLFSNLLAEGEELVLGKTYTEVCDVTNSGAIDSYVRVIITKSWVDAEGNKNTTLSPDLIELNVLEGNGWVIDTASSTPERTVLYYTNILPVEESTPAFTDTLSINEAIGTKVIENVTVDENTGYKTITYTHEYDGYTFNVEVEVDAVQTHNAADAIKSAWGVDVTVAEDGSISLQ